MNKHILLLNTLGLVVSFTISTAYAEPPLQQLYTNAQKTGLRTQVLQDALKSYRWASAHGSVHNPNVLTVVDYTKPSTANRLWVLDLKTGSVLINTLVAQGRNSGLKYALHFSNNPESHESSLGVFTTGLSPYYGKHGQSLRVYGLEKGINNNAYERAIEIHGADYVSAYNARNYGYIGRTWGCFGVSESTIKKIVTYTKGGSVLFAYAAPENNDPVVARG